MVEMGFSVGADKSFRAGKDRAIEKSVPLFQEGRLR